MCERWHNCEDGKLGSNSAWAGRHRGMPGPEHDPPVSQYYHFDRQLQRSLDYSNGHENVFGSVGGLRRAVLPVSIGVLFSGGNLGIMRGIHRLSTASSVMHCRASPTHNLGMVRIAHRARTPKRRKRGSRDPLGLGSLWQFTQSPEFA